MVSFHLSWFCFSAVCSFPWCKIYGGGDSHNNNFFLWLPCHNLFTSINSKCEKETNRSLLLISMCQITYRHAERNLRIHLLVVLRLRHVQLKLSVSLHPTLLWLWQAVRGLPLNALLENYLLVSVVFNIQACSHEYAFYFDKLYVKHVFEKLILNIPFFLSIKVFFFWWRVYLVT